MSSEINVTDGTILEVLNGKIDIDGGNYPSSGLEAIIGDKYRIAMMLINEKNFELDCMAKIMEHDLTKTFIQIFEETETIDTTQGDGAYCVENYYDPDAHIFVKNDDTTKVIYSIPKEVTTGNNNVWCKTDWMDLGDGVLTLEISRDGGNTWTELVEDTLISISSQPAGTSMVLRVTGSGKMKLKNLAWGMKA